MNHQGIINDFCPTVSGESATQGGNGEEDPLRTVVVNFKGAVQCLGHLDYNQGLTWIGMDRLCTTYFPDLYATSHLSQSNWSLAIKNVKPIPLAKEDLHHCLAVWNCSWRKRMERLLHLSRLGLWVGWVWCIWHLDKGRMIQICLQPKIRYPKVSQSEDGNLKLMLRMKLENSV